MSTNERIHIDLTSEQQSEIKRVSGKDIAALEFDGAELEQRITPDFVITKQVDASSPALFKNA